MGGVGSAVAYLEGAEQRAPVAAVGMDGPESPQVMAAQSLRFQRAEHDAAILEDHRVERHAQVEIADALDVVAVVVHGEELQGEGIRRVTRIDRLERVAIADED